MLSPGTLATDCTWLALEHVQPIHVAAYIEELGALRSKPTVKQHMAAIRMLFDWLSPAR